MSRFKKLSHALWYGHYHLVWTPKYRYRILKGEIKAAVENCIKMYSDWLDCEIKALNVQDDHVHLLIMIPPKISVSDYVGTVKGKTAIMIFKNYPKLKERPYWGNHFWAKGYCMDTVGLDLEMIRKYVIYQEQQEKLAERKR